MRVSVSTSGEQANSASYNSSISGDGRYVAFESTATNLVPGTAGFVPGTTQDIYVYDLKTRRTELVSVGLDGNPTGAISAGAAISGDGRFVAFMSRSGGLVKGDNNFAEEVFVRDRQTQKTERVSVDSDGGELTTHSSRPSISADGRYVGFVTGSNTGQGEAMVHDRQTGKTIRLSTPMSGTGDTLSEAPVLSADGRFAAFMSGSPELVPDDTNGADIFVYEMATGNLSLVSVGAEGQSNGSAFLPAISGDGRPNRGVRH